MLNRNRSAWWFDVSSAGTMMTSGLRALLEGAHLTGPELFVREVTQNSVDARLPDSNDPVRLRFSSYSLTPSQSDTLGQFLLADGQLRRHLTHFIGKDDFAQDGGFFLRAEQPGRGTRVLLVEDFETKGLGGTIGGDAPEDHFSRLVYFFGQSHQDGTTGGAFGFGKSVYSVASDVRTVIYYSRPAGHRTSRLIGVSLFPSHSIDGRRYTGYALCGDRGPDDSFPIVPIEGVQADEIASGLGMVRRAEGNSGTSLLVVDCAYSAESLQLALEKWWWPRLVTTGPGGLVAEAYQDGTRLLPPNPEARPELEGFVRAYNHLLDVRDDTSEAIRRVVKSIGQRVVGSVALRRIDAPNEEEAEEAWHSHSVALIRGPKLVVRYERMGRQHLTPFVGVFAVDEGMNPIFQKSENPAHDTWAPESGRLNDAERVFIRAVYKRCKEYAREFQASFIAKPVAPTSRLRVLEDLLGKLFQRGQSPGSVPKGDARPVAMSVRERRIEARGIDEAVIEIRPKSTGDAIPARLQVTAHLLGDAQKTQIDSLHVELYDGEDRVLSQGKQVEQAFDLAPGGAARFIARTRPPAGSLVRFTVTVTGRSA